MTDGGQSVGPRTAMIGASVARLHHAGGLDEHVQDDADEPDHAMVTDLSGNTARERAIALAKITHPDDRPDLMDAAEKLQ